MKWEYLRQVDISNDELNALGNVGWELVAITPESQSKYQEFFFKRPIHEAVPEVAVPEVSVPEATARVIDMEDIGR